MNADEVVAAVKEFVLSDVWPQGNPAELDERTPLIENGILDSLSLLRVVAFLEKTYEIRVAAHEADEDNFGSLRAIAAFVERKAHGAG